MTTYERAILFEMREELAAAKEKLGQQLQELDRVLQDDALDTILRDSAEAIGVLDKGPVTLKNALEQFVKDGDQATWHKALRES